jgi:hypothetical protein
MTCKQFGRWKLSGLEEFAAKRYAGHSSKKVLQKSSIDCVISSFASAQLTYAVGTPDQPDGVRDSWNSEHSWSKASDI